MIKGFYRWQKFLIPLFSKMFMGNYKNKFWHYLYGFIFLSSIFQIYIIKINESYIAITFILFPLLLPLAIKKISIVKWKPIFFFILIIFFQVISLAWSSDYLMGIKQILLEINFVIMFLSAYMLAITHPFRSLFIFKIFLILLFIPGLLVLLFKYAPSLEEIFLRSNLAGIFINPNNLSEIYGERPNNVIDVSKSGGFFVNANVASAYFGISGFISLGLWRAYRKFIFLFLSMGLLLFSLLTGSKAGLLLLLVFGLMNLWLNRSSIKYLYTILTLIGSIILGYIFDDFLMDFNEKSLSAIDVRNQIWLYGFSIFMDNIFTGVGFGGWQEGFKQYAYSSSLSESYPPHNTLIYLWSQSGIVAIILYLLFIYYIIYFSIRLIKSKNLELRGLGFGLFISNLWVFLHGMGTNFGIIGDDHIFIILSVILGYSYARYKVLNA